MLESKSLDFWKHITPLIVPFDHPIFENCNSDAKSNNSNQLKTENYKTRYLKHVNAEMPNSYLVGNEHEDSFKAKVALDSIQSIKYVCKYDGYKQFTCSCSCTNCRKCKFNETSDPKSNFFIEGNLENGFKRSGVKKNTFGYNRSSLTDLLKNAKSTPSPIRQDNDKELYSEVRCKFTTSKRRLTPQVKIRRLEDTICFLRNLGLRPVWKNRSHCLSPVKIKRLRKLRNLNSIRK